MPGRSLLLTACGPSALDTPARIASTSSKAFWRTSPPLLSPGAARHEKLRTGHQILRLQPRLGILEWRGHVLPGNSARARRAWASCDVLRTGCVSAAGTPGHRGSRLG